MNYLSFNEDALEEESSKFSSSSTSDDESSFDEKKQVTTPCKKRTMPQRQVKNNNNGKKKNKPIKPYSRYPPLQILKSGFRYSQCFWVQRLFQTDEGSNMRMSSPIFRPLKL